MMDFDEMMLHAHSLQVNYIGIDPGALTGEERAEYVRSMVLAATDELHEAMHEVAWKPWKVDQGEIRDRPAYIEELVDVMHFIANLLLVVDADGEEVSQMYEHKMRTNMERLK